MVNSMNTDNEVTNPVCINLQMLRASHYIMKAYDEAYRPHGIRATQMPVLGTVARMQPVSIKTIADELESERSVISRRLRVMQDNGWVRQDPKSCGKEKTFVLTARGKNLIKRVLPTRLEVQSRLMNVLSEDEQNLLLNLCNKLKSAS